MFIIHPSWTLPVSVVARGFIYFGLIGYFVLCAYIAKRWIEPFTVSAPPFIPSRDILNHAKDHLWLMLVCLVAVLLHMKPISSQIYLVGDEALFLQNGLWVYDYFGAFWHQTARYIFWTVIILTPVMLRIKSAYYSRSLSSNNERRTHPVYFALFSGAFLLVIYFILLRDLPFQGRMVRYPPLQNFLYLLSYFIFGINHVAARLWQLVFYILSAVYLYRTIDLFSDKKTALLGASVYLFSPIIFDYAHFAELASGLIFFIILISYYFLRYVIYQDKRGLLLASYLIGTGFLYKRDIFLMFFICSAYLLYCKIKNNGFQLIRPLKILALSLFPIIPWMIIGKFFTWRNAWVSLAPFKSLEKVSAYLLSIPAEISWIVFIFFVLSIFYLAATKRNHLTYYWGFVFISFYTFYTSQNVPKISHRFSMAFYPTIAVFMSLLLSDVIHKIKWKHTFKIIFVSLTVSLIALCTVPSFSERFIAYRDVKAQYFPVEQAMRWVRDNMNEGEKLLTLRLKPDMFYADKFGIDKNDIISNWYDLTEFSTPEKLRVFSCENKINYILIPQGPNFISGRGTYNNEILEHLKKNENNEFTEAAKFNIGENYIYIHKVNFCKL